MAVPTCQIQNSKPRRFAQNSTKCLSINRRHVLFRCLYLLSRQGSLGRSEGHDLRAPPRESGKHRKIMFGLGLDQRKRPVMTRVDSGASVSHAGEVDT